MSEHRSRREVVTHWRELPRARLLSVAVDIVQYGVAVVLLILAAVVLVRSFIDFIGSPGGYPQTLVSAVDGILVVIILVDILRTVMTHLQGRGFPYRPFLVIGIIAGVREILAVSTRLTLNSAGNAQSVTQSLFQLGTSAVVVLVLAVALWITRGQVVTPDEQTVA
jgi:uncharacterized membrane protein (DUF373 family)